MQGSGWGCPQGKEREKGNIKESVNQSQPQRHPVCVSWEWLCPGIPAAQEKWSYSREACRKHGSRSDAAIGFTAEQLGPWSAALPVTGGLLRALLKRCHTFPTCAPTASCFHSECSHLRKGSHGKNEFGKADQKHVMKDNSQPVD